MSLTQITVEAFPTPAHRVVQPTSLVEGGELRRIGAFQRAKAGDVLRRDVLQ
jgi:hypothetical protein